MYLITHKRNLEIKTFLLCLRLPPFLQGLRIHKELSQKLEQVTATYLTFFSQALFNKHSVSRYVLKTGICANAVSVMFHELILALPYDVNIILYNLEMRP